MFVVAITTIFPDIAGRVYVTSDEATSNSTPAEYRYIAMQKCERTTEIFSPEILNFKILFSLSSSRDCQTLYFTNFKLQWSSYANVQVLACFLYESYFTREIEYATCIPVALSAVALSVLPTKFSGTALVRKSERTLGTLIYPMFQCAYISILMSRCDMWWYL